jgi:hypothetical protein
MSNETVRKTVFMDAGDGGSMRREGNEMRYAVLLIALIGVGMAPFAASGQQKPRAPLDILLEYRGELALTAAQVARLDSIKAGLEAKNKPLIDRVLTLRAEAQREQRAVNRAAGRRGQALRQNPMQTPAQPNVARLEQLRSEIQSLVKQTNANNAAAMREQVRPMLTQRQRQRLNQLIQAEQQKRPAGGAPPPPAALGG